MRERFANYPDFAEPSADRIASWGPVRQAPARRGGLREAIDALRSGAGSAEQFDAIFGPGAARRALGGQ